MTFAPDPGGDLAVMMGAQPRKAGLGGYLERFADPEGSALGRIGLALLSSGDGPLSGFAQSLYGMNRQRSGDRLEQLKYQEALRKSRMPQTEHVGDTFGTVDPTTGTYTPTYTAPSPLERDRGYFNGVEQGLGDTYIRNKANPDMAVQGFDAQGRPTLTFVPRSQAVPGAPLPPPITSSEAPAPANMLGITAQSESGGREYNPDGSRVTSPAGALGIMQVMPATARQPGYGVRPSNGTPDDDARVGRDYLAAMLKKSRGDPAKAWAAYNGGPGRLDSVGGNIGAMPAETRAYVAKNMRALKPAPQRTKVLSNGQTAYFVNGAWYDNPEGR